VGAEELLVIAGAQEESGTIKHSYYLSDAAADTQC
jgi:hypothetical protein